MGESQLHKGDCSRETAGERVIKKMRLTWEMKRNGEEDATCLRRVIVESIKEACECGGGKSA